MKKLHLIFVLLELFVYITVYKLFLISHREIIRYIINPLMWILFAVLFSIVFDKKRSYKYLWECIYIVIIGSLSYIIIFYTLGFFFGYTKNPYSITLSGIIVNSFSILLVLGLKEYIRNLLIWQVNNYRILYFSLIFILFVLSDLNWTNIINSFNDFLAIFSIIAQEIIPTISINLFMMYLCINSGYIPGAIYRIIIFLPTLILPIVPKYDWVITTLFDILFPLLMFSIIQYIIDKRNKMIQFDITKPFNVKKRILILPLIVIIIIFGLGGFGIKPVVILTGSMRPTINEGDLVIIEKVDIEDIKAGDIIIYKVDNYSVIHRVIMILKDSNEISLITKGDNNPNRDLEPVKKNQILGRLKYQIPFVGYPSYAFQKLIGFKK